MKCRKFSVKCDADGLRDKCSLRRRIHYFNSSKSCRLIISVALIGIGIGIYLGSLRMRVHVLYFLTTVAKVGMRVRQHISTDIYQVARVKRGPTVKTARSRELEDRKVCRLQKDFVCYFMWNERHVVILRVTDLWKNHIKAQLNPSIKQDIYTHRWFLRTKSHTRI